MDTIATERLWLQPVTPEWVRRTFARETDSRIKELLGISSDEELARYRARFAVQDNAYISYRLFMIRDRPDGPVIGSCNYHVWQVPHARAEIGYLVGEPYRNRGYAAEAMRAVLIHGFEEMSLNRVEAFLSPQNIASSRLVHRFGFTYEGILREHYFKNGVYEDSACYSLLKREYQAKRADWEILG